MERFYQLMTVNVGIIVGKSGFRFFSPAEREPDSQICLSGETDSIQDINKTAVISGQDELVSAGCLGLIDAVDKFNPAKDVSLKTYAQYRIKGAILDECEAWTGTPDPCEKRFRI